MSNITKKQISLALVAVVFATAMIVGTIVSTDDVMAFAKKHKSTHKHNGSSSSNSQSTSQNNLQAQSSNCVTPGGAGGTTGGAGGAVGGSCNNVAVNQPINTGGSSITIHKNGHADVSSYVHNSQKTSQNNAQAQTSNCVTPGGAGGTTGGAGGAVTGSCNNLAVNQPINTGSSSITHE
jgi:hypothetical protein